MNWLVSLFSGGNKQSSRRGQAMTTTQEAFSLPRSTPHLNPLTDPYNSDGLRTASPLSPSYTYPPQSPTSSYSYVPTSSGSRSRPTSLLPLHHTPYADALTPPPPYPPLAHTWNRARVTPSTMVFLPQDLAQIEMQLGFALPAPVRESYLAGCSDGLFFGLTLLPMEDVFEEWRFWREVDEDPTTGANTRLRDSMKSIPDGWVRKEYSQRGWIPLIVDKAGNYIGVDLNPGEGGSAGQVIVFGRDFDTKVVLWRGDGPGGWATWLASFVDELESGEGFELGQGNSESEGSEDNIGYENYFHDGTGGGQGDSGGEAGVGGWRLTGEYRGWSPIEAWADKSVKKWREAGLLIKPPSSTINRKATENHDLRVLDLSESCAVVPIPVLEDTPDGESTASSAATKAAANPPLPTISITKPPPPLPIGVPTVSDVIPLPSPPDSQRSSTDDLEAGRALGYRESLYDSTLPGRVLHPLIAVIEIPKVQSTAPVIDDLLAESTPLEAVPTMSPARKEPETSSPDVPNLEASSPTQSEAEEPAGATIRLVSEGQLPMVDSLPLSDEGKGSMDSTGTQLQRNATHQKNSLSSSSDRGGSSVVDLQCKRDSSGTNSTKNDDISNSSDRTFTL
ncbi:hypothetical protein EDC04DRAFT_2695352 [Pisolithus marmoratus]|nr:hypothetical protein EDC04DRAFT_2695352 [Pisolithus marmoratus]